MRGKYELLERIGVGGMGSVYRARHVFTGEVGALKLLHAHRGAEERSVLRFLREARTVSLARSPHIVEVKDAGGLRSRRPFIFMELLQGFTLKRLLEREGKLAPSLVVELTEQAARGLATAHRAGIIHRDIKPDNLFLETTGGPELPRLKLLDFGISKLDAALDPHEALTRQGATLGTPGYMAPEQFFDSASVDHRADVYALGVVAYQCLAGRLPFAAATIRQQSEEALRAELPPLTEAPADLGPPLHRILEKALRPRAEDRYAETRELASALATIAGSPEQARRDWQAVAADELVQDYRNTEEHRAIMMPTDAGGDFSSEEVTYKPRDSASSEEVTTVVPWISWEDLEPSDGVDEKAPGASSKRTTVGWPASWRGVLIGVVGAAGIVGAAVGLSQGHTPGKASGETGSREKPTLGSTDRTETDRRETKPRALQPASVEQPTTSQAKSEPTASARVRSATPPPASSSRDLVNSANSSSLRQRRVEKIRKRQRPTASAPESASSAANNVVEGKFGTRFVREFE